MIPLWGSIRSLLNSLYEGRVGWAVLDAGLVLLDLVTVPGLKEIAIGLGQAGKNFLKNPREAIANFLKSEAGSATQKGAQQAAETGGSAGAKGGANTARQTPPPHQAKPSKHHFAAIENKEFTPRIKEITDKYGLDLDGAWNKELLPWNNGRHPKEYHDWVLDQMQRADIEAAGNVEKFLELIEKYVKKPVRENPEMLRKFYW